MFLSYVDTKYPEIYNSWHLQRPDILEIPIDAVIAWSLVSWLAVEVTGNSSFVDRLWTFMPPMYTAYFTLLPLFSWAPLDIQAAGISPRCVLMLTVQLLWCFRLSYNTWRRGLFSLSEEDYRWALLRERLPGVLYKIFNLTFIAFTQHFLLFAQGLPAYTATCQPRDAPTVFDIALFVLGLLTLAVQFTADNQQWGYQNFKRGTPIKNPWPFADCNWTELDAKRGFVAEGLWGISRHPNFLCEQAFWLLTSLYPILGEPNREPLSTSPFSYFPGHQSQYKLSGFIAHPDSSPLWPLASPLAYCLLFLASTKFTEAITAGKYSTYAFYQERVGMFNPFSTFLKGAWLGTTGREQTVGEAVWKHKKAE